MPNTDATICIMGFIMDEAEARFPEAFNQWLDMPAPNDFDLRKIINAGK